jgi:membrane dipeptidase
MEAATVSPGPLAGRKLGVIDLHTHPTLKTRMFNRHFWTKHNPPGFMFPLCMRNDIDALIDGNVKALLCAIYALEPDMAQDVWPLRGLEAVVPRAKHLLKTPTDVLTREYLDELERVVAETRKRRGDVVEIARSYADMQRIMAQGKVCFLHSIEGAHHLNGSFDNLKEFHDRGVCHMILPHFYPNPACGCVDPIPDNLPLRKIGCFTLQRDPNSGLTPWGRELVERMLDMGMIVDMCHTTPTCRKEILDVARNYPRKRPVSMCHVGVHKYAPYPMNPTAGDIREIADTGGVIGIIFMTFWLQKPEVRDGAEIILKTVEHLIEHGGEEVVSFGSDFDGFTGVPRDFKSPRDYNRLRGLLLQKYSENQVEKFLGGNADRLLREGWGR